MKHFLVPLVVLCVLPTARAAEPFALKDGDRVVLLGNTLIEREQRYGYWEVALTIAAPRKNVTFRNLGWSGDTAWGEARASFDPPEVGFRRLKERVTEAKPTVIIVGYGFNESFAGAAGLPRFKKQLDLLLDTLEATKVRLVILGPQRQEDLGRPLPDPTAQNKHIQLYRDAMRETAQKRGHHFVDLCEVLANEKPPLSDNGIHFTADGYWRSGRAIADQLLGKQVSGSTLNLPASGLVEPKPIRLPLPPEPGSGSARTVIVKDLQPGKHTLFIGGKATVTAPAADWARGVKLPCAMDPDCVQVEKLRAAIIEKNSAHFHNWRPQNWTYLFGFRKGEQGQNAKEIPQFEPIIAQLEKDIAALRMPSAHTYELKKETDK